MNKNPGHVTVLVVTLTILGAIPYVLISVFLPELLAVLKGAGEELPLPTRFVIDYHNGMNGAYLVGLVAALWLLIRRPAGESTAAGLLALVIAHFVAAYLWFGYTVLALYLPVMPICCTPEAGI